MMKLKTKLTKKQWGMIGGAAAVTILLAIILCVALIPGRSPQSPAENEPDTQSAVSVSDISIEEPEKTDDTSSDTTSETEGSDGDVTAESLPDGVSILTPDEKTEDDTSEQTGEKPDTPEQPVVPKPLPDESESGGGIVIGGGNKPEPYSCGVEGHHCEGPETHAFILNLELEGCKYCGSHNCPSFYGTDKWGGGGLFPKLCPKYDIHKDPAYYCHTCGKECGSGSPDKCVQFVNSDHCPICGEWVEAWTCHSCK